MDGLSGDDQFRVGGQCLEGLEPPRVPFDEHQPL